LLNLIRTQPRSIRPQSSPIGDCLESPTHFMTKIFRSPPPAASACSAKGSTSQRFLPAKPLESKRSKTAFGSPFSWIMIWDTSSWNKGLCSPRQSFPPETVTHVSGQTSVGWLCTQSKANQSRGQIPLINREIKGKLGNSYPFSGRKDAPNHRPVERPGDVIARDILLSARISAKLTNLMASSIPVQ
jgi:hypothetical protein